MAPDSRTQLDTERELLESVRQIKAEYEDLTWEYWRALNGVGDVGPDIAGGVLSLVRSLEKRLQSAIQELQPRVA